MARDSFMQPEITDKMSGWEIETNEGTFFLPGFVLATDAGSEMDIVSEAADYVQGVPVSGEVVTGYFGRYSAPGYLDATDWSFSPNRRKLEKELRDLYGDND